MEKCCAPPRHGYCGHSFAPCRWGAQLRTMFSTPAVAGGFEKHWGLLGKGTHSKLKFESVRIFLDIEASKWEFTKKIRDRTINHGNTWNMEAYHDFSLMCGFEKR